MGLISRVSSLTYRIMQSTDKPPEIYAGELGMSESFLKIQRARQHKKTDTWINDVFAVEERVKVSCLDMNEMLRELDMFVDNEPRLDLGQVAQMKAKFENKVGKSELKVSVSSKRIPTYDARKYLETNHDHENSKIKKIYEKHKKSEKESGFESESLSLEKSSTKLSKTDQFQHQYQNKYSNQSNGVINNNPKKRVKLSKSILEKSRCFEPRLNVTFLSESILLKIFKKIPESSNEIRKVCTKFKRVINNNKISFEPDFDDFSKHKFQRRINKFEKKQDWSQNEWASTKRTEKPNQRVFSTWKSNQIRVNGSQIGSSKSQTQANQQATSKPRYFNQDISQSFNFQQNNVSQNSNKMEIRYPYNFQQNYSNYFGYNH